MKPRLTFIHLLFLISISSPSRLPRWVDSTGPRLRPHPPVLHPIPPPSSTTPPLAAPRVSDSPTWRGLAGEAPPQRGGEPRPRVSSPAEVQRYGRWAHAAWGHVERTDCRRASFTTATRCAELLRRAKSSVAVYTASAREVGSGRGRLRVVLPSGDLDPLTPGGRVDGVLALDPYAEANFGHLVLVYYVTREVTRASCRLRGGVFVESDSDCLVLAVKQRCHNAVERRNRRRNFDLRCEVDFLPLVLLATDDVTTDVSDDVSGDNATASAEGLRPHARTLRSRRQVLACRDDVAGFAPSCPDEVPPDPRVRPACDATRDNTKHCETTHDVLPAASARCRWYETCDEAVLISGGWNEWTQRRHHHSNVEAVYRMLRENGYRHDGIKVFHTNGVRPDPELEATADFYPAAYKSVFRFHIQNLCGSPHCVDSLFIYLNNPSQSDGTSLLWDANQDGVASDGEKYTVSELKSDLAGCQARQVYVVADQSYSGEVARLFRRSKAHRNVAVYASGRDVDYAHVDEFTRAWTRTNHTRRCTADVFREAKRTAHIARPQMQHGEDIQNVNIFGAPCTVTPPFTRDELRQNYLGCQNLPSAIWAARLQHLIASSPSGVQGVVAPGGGPPPAGEQGPRTGLAAGRTGGGGGSTVSPRGKAGRPGGANKKRKGEQKRDRREEDLAEDY